MQYIAQYIVMFETDRDIQSAYLGKHAQAWMLQSSDQLASVYLSRGLTISVTVSSTLHYIWLNEGASLADIGRGLNHPHQLVSLRIGKLMKGGLVEKRPDPHDGRRWEYHLTQDGQRQGQILDSLMRDTAEIYREIFSEIGCDLSQKIVEACLAIRRETLPERFARAFPESQSA